MTRWDFTVNWTKWVVFGNCNYTADVLLDVLSENGENRFKCAKLRRHRARGRDWRHQTNHVQFSDAISVEKLTNIIGDVLLRIHSIDAGRVHNSQGVRGAKTFRVINVVDVGTIFMSVDVELETERITPLDVKHVVE